MTYLIIADYPYNTTKNFFEEEPTGEYTEKYVEFPSNRLLQQRCYEISDYDEIVSKEGRISINYKIIKQVWLK